MAWVVAILVLSALIIVHEYGHFLVARRSGVHVQAFSIGFGPKVLAWRRGQTEYRISAIPLGGYVKMAGEQHTEQTRQPGEFLSQPIGTRARIIAAGPLVNYVTSIVTLWIVLVIGYPELMPTVGQLVEQMPAQSAGLAVGDRIVAIDGHPVRTWDELTRLVHDAAGQSLRIALERDQQRLSVTVVPETKEVTDPFGRQRVVGLIGIAPSGEITTYRVSPLQAVGQTIQKQLEWTSQIGLSLWSLVVGRVSARESLTGPIGIVYLTSEAAKLGLGSLLYLVSLFSLSLAIFNLFPIPVLDGGHLLFLVMEKLRGGRPVSLHVQERAAQVSMALLLFLVVLVCVNDVSRFGLLDKLVEWWRG